MEFWLPKMSHLKVSHCTSHLSWKNTFTDQTEKSHNWGTEVHEAILTSPRPVTAWFGSLWTWYFHLESEKKPMCLGEGKWSWALRAQWSSVDPQTMQAEYVKEEGSEKSCGLKRKTVQWRTNLKISPFLIPPLHQQPLLSLCPFRSSVSDNTRGTAGWTWTEPSRQRVALRSWKHWGEPERRGPV